MFTNNSLVVLLACLALSGQVSVALEIKEADYSCHRLPINVKPTSYDIDIKLPNWETYEGTVDIGVEFVKGTPTSSKFGSKRAVVDDFMKGLKNVDCPVETVFDQIVMHADKMINIEEIKVSVDEKPNLGRTDGKNVQVLSVTRDDAKQIIVLKLASQMVQRSTGTVSIKFNGSMTRGDKRGLYVSSYNDGRHIYKHVVTQFQPTDARTVLPCFDEPRFKAPFKLTLAHKKGLTAYSTMQVAETSEEDGLTKIEFEKTPKMSIHMFAFTVGHFDVPLVETYTPKKGEPYDIRILTVPGKREKGALALDIAKSSARWMENFAQRAYPLKKLDIVAIAEHDKDNTESWGLTFVRDTLIWFDDETMPSYKLNIIINVAHVVAHQWYANLVTPAWWTDLWITEGLATYSAVCVAEEVYTGLQYGMLLRLGLLEPQIAADQTGKQHVLSPPEQALATSEGVYSIFDVLEFIKSGALTYQISNTMRFQHYREVNRELVRKYAYGIVDTQDYLEIIRKTLNEMSDTLARTPDEIERMVNNWIHLQGIPLINVGYSSKDKLLNLYAEPYHKASTEMELYGGKRASTLGDFQINTSIMYSDGRMSSGKLILISSDNYSERNGMIGVYDTPTYSLDKSNNYVTLGFVHISSFFRVRYSDELMAHLGRDMAKYNSGGQIRMRLLDDATNLVQSGLMKPKVFKSFLDSYASQKHFGIMIEVMKALEVWNNLESSDKSPSPVSKTIWNIYKEYGFKVKGWEANLEQKARQMALMKFILEGNQQVINDALKAFDAVKGKVAIFLREPVYTAIVLAGTSNQVNQLVEKLSITDSYEEKVRLAAALSLSKDNQVLNTVKSWLETSGLKPESKEPILETLSKASSDK